MSQSKTRRKRPELVFVYGTLQREGLNNRIMVRAAGEFRSVAETTERYPLIIPGVIPFLMHFPGFGHHVTGELWGVNDIQVLDRLEGHPWVYRRRKVIIKHGDNESLAWTYFYTGKIPHVLSLTHHRQYDPNVFNDFFE